MLKKHFITASYYPPGYEYEKEKNAARLLLGIGAGLSLRFFGSLSAATEKLYEHVRGQCVLKAGVRAAPFAQLVREHWMFYIPLLFFLLSVIPLHCFYYYRTTKSIYLMRRLPRRVLFKSCVQGPLILLAASALLLAVLYLLYYGIYRLKIPAECLP